MAKSTEVVPTAGVPDGLRQISSYDAARAYALSQGPITSVQELGDGFVVIKSDQKHRLVGVPFLTVGIDVGHDEKTDREYVVVRLVTENGTKLILTDGSTGIKQQILDLARDRAGVIPQFIEAPGGLVQSDYDTTDASGATISATTFYFDLSPANVNGKF